MSSSVRKHLTFFPFKTTHPYTCEIYPDVYLPGHSQDLNHKVSAILLTFFIRLLLKYSKWVVFGSCCLRSIQLTIFDIDHYVAKNRIIELFSAYVEQTSLSKLTKTWFKYIITHSHRHLHHGRRKGRTRRWSYLQFFYITK